MNSNISVTNYYYYYYYYYYGVTLQNLSIDRHLNTVCPPEIVMLVGKTLTHHPLMQIFVEKRHQCQNWKHQSYSNT